MKEKKRSDLSVLLNFAGSYKGLTFLGLGLSAVAMILGMLPYICIWLVARDLIAAAPDWTQTAGIARYGWIPWSSVRNYRNYEKAGRLRRKSLLKAALCRYRLFCIDSVRCADRKDGMNMKHNKKKRL